MPAGNIMGYYHKGDTWLAFQFLLSAAIIECILASWPTQDRQVPWLTLKSGSGNLTRAALGGLIPPPWSNLSVSWRPFTNAPHILRLATSTFFTLSHHSDTFHNHSLVITYPSLSSLPPLNTPLLTTFLSQDAADRGTKWCRLHFPEQRRVPSPWKVRRPARERRLWRWVK